MASEKSSDEKQRARGGIGLNSITRRDYLSLIAVIGGLLSTGGTKVTSPVIDDFEWYGSGTTLADVYSMHTGAFSVATDTVLEGTQSLYSGSSGGQFMNSTTGLNTYPAIGDTIEWYTWSEASAGDRLHFLAQSETSGNNHYSIDHSLRDNRMQIGVYVDDNSEYFAADTSFTTARDQRWLRHRLETEDTGSAYRFTYEIYQYNASGEDVLLNSISGSDADASISDGREFSTGGIGWLVYGNSGTQRWFDGLAKVDDGGDDDGGDDLDAVESVFELDGNRRNAEITAVSGSSASATHRHRERNGTVKRTTSHEPSHTVTATARRRRSRSSSDRTTGCLENSAVRRTV